MHIKLTWLLLVYSCLHHLNSNLNEFYGLKYKRLVLSQNGWLNKIGQKNFVYESSTLEDFFLATAVLSSERFMLKSYILPFLDPSKARTQDCRFSENWLSLFSLLTFTLNINSGNSSKWQIQIQLPDLCTSWHIFKFQLQKKQIVLNSKTLNGIRFIESITLTKVDPMVPTHAKKFNPQWQNIDSKRKWKV